MKKVWKYIVGFFSFVGGILTLVLLSSNKNKKVKELKGKIKDNEKQVKEVSSKIKSAEKQGKEIKKSLDSKKEALDDIEKKREEFLKSRENISADDANTFLKNYAKKSK